MKLYSNLKVFGFSCCTVLFGASWVDASSDQLSEKVVNLVTDNIQNTPKWIQERRVRSGESFRFFAPALSWQIKEISLNWDCDSSIQAALREEIGKSDINEEIILTETGYRRNTSKIKRIEDRTGLSLNSAQAANCFSKIFTGSLKVPVPEYTYEHSEHDILEKSYVEFDEERKTGSYSIRNYLDKVSSYLESKTITNPKLTVVVEFTNRTGESMSVREFALPILFKTGEKLGDALPERSPEIIYPRKGGMTPLVFNYPLDNTRSLDVLVDISNARVDVLKSTGTFMTNDSGCDLLREVSEDRKLFIVGATEAGIIHFRDNDQPNKVTAFIEELNQQIDANFIGIDSGFSNTCLEFVSGAKSNMDGFWCVCILDNRGEKKALSLDSYLPAGKDIIICKINPNEAKRSWFDEGMKNDNAMAFYWMGYCWENGIDGEKDFGKAVECFSKAVKRGFSAPEEFQQRMGAYYSKGRIGERDFPKELLGTWRAAWENAMQVKVNTFTGGLKGEPPEEMLKQLDGFLKENAENPYKDEACRFVLKCVREFFDSKFKSWDGSEESYKSVECVCGSILNSSSSVIKSSKLYSFANRYVSWLKSYSRKVDVHAIRHKRVSLGETYLERIECKGGQTKKFDRDDSTGNNFVFSLESPWEKVTLILKKSKKGSRSDVVVGLGELKLGEELKREYWQLKVTVKPLDGKTIHELWTEAK